MAQNFKNQIIIIMPDITYIQDVKKVKRLLSENRGKDAVAYLSTFLSEYNFKVLNGLNPFERAELLNVDRFQNSKS